MNVRAIFCKNGVFIFMVISGLVLSGLSGILESKPRDDSKARNARIKQWKRDLESELLPENAVKLKFKSSIPKEEEDVSLRFPANICQDRHGNIYVSDSRNHTVYKFNAEGRFLKKIGRKGKGPGDLLNPLYLHIDRIADLVVLDANNFRVQLFDPGGNYKKSFRTFETYTSLVIDGEGSVFCSPLGFDKPLIRMFDYSGKSIGSFGQRIKFKKDIFGLNKVHMSMNNKGEIYVAWELFPIVRRYSKDKMLLVEYKLTYPKMIKDTGFNYRSIDSPPHHRQYKIVIAGIKAKDNGFFIFFYYPRIEILEYNNKGEMENLYWAEQPYDFIGNDFIVKQGPGGKKLFYILQVFPEGKIDIYSN